MVVLLLSNLRLPGRIRLFSDLRRSRIQVDTPEFALVRVSFFNYPKTKISKDKAISIGVLGGYKFIRKPINFKFTT